MKTFLALLLSFFLLASCRKDKANCYNCTFGTLNGVSRPPEEYCGDMPHVFTDASGAEMSSFCVPK